MGQGSGDTGDAPAEGDAGKPVRAVGDPINATPEQTTRYVPRPRYKVLVMQEGSLSYDPLKSAMNTGTTHNFIADDMNFKHASRDEILTGLRKMLRGDIFTADLHTHLLGKASDLDPPAGGVLEGGWFAPTGTNRKVVQLAEMVAALKSGSGPAAVVLSGCASAKMLADVMTANVGVAFGIGAPISLTAKLAGVNSSAMAQAVTAALMTGKSIAEARQAGQDAIDPKVLGYVQVEVVVQCADDVLVTRSLQANGLLPRFPAAGP